MAEAEAFPVGGASGTSSNEPALGPADSRPPGPDEGRETQFTHDDRAEGKDHRKHVSLPLAAFPPAAIIGIAIAGAVAGPMWATALAVASLTGVGMWVARITDSPQTALLAAAVGAVLGGGAVLYYSMLEPDPLSNASGYEWPGGSTQLGGADLSGADLRGISLREANLRAADFSGACLLAVDFRGADLTDAVFAGADVSGVLIDGDMQVAVARDWPAAPPTPSPCDDNDQPPQ